MNERMRDINRTLRMLDEAHFLGRIQQADYRQRRRHLLGTLCDGGGITARNTIHDRTVPRRPLRDPVTGKSDNAWVGKVRPAWWKRLFLKQR